MAGENRPMLRPGHPDLDRQAVDKRYAHPSGWRRLGGAIRCSSAGFGHALRHESAFRQELAVTILLAPLAIALPLPAVERFVLVASMLGVLAVELLNSAIEMTVDRISLEPHPLSGHAKDLGSAAVAVAVVVSLAAWVVIAGPLLLRWR